MSEQTLEDSAAKIPKNLGRWLLLAVIAGIAIYLVLSIYADIGSVAQAFTEFKWGYIPLILFLTLMNYFLRFAKWDYYLRRIKIRVSTKDSMAVFLSGLTMSITPAKLGEVFKSYILKRLNGTGISQSIPIVFAERATDVIGLLILAAISFSAFQYGWEVLIIILAVLVPMIIIIQSRRLSFKLLDIFRKVPLINRFTGNIKEAYEGAYILFRPKPLAIAIVISVVSWGFECLALYFVLLGFGIDASVLLSTFVFSFSSLAGTVSMIPGGLLVAEGSFTGLLVLAGVAKALAASSTVVIRFCTLWFGVMIGLVTLYLIRGRLVREHRA